jgi:hypothetical protein
LVEDRLRVIQQPGLDFLPGRAPLPHACPRPGVGEKIEQFLHERLGRQRDGVAGVFTADGIPEGDEGELIQGVKSWQARQYSVKLARDSIRGQLSNLRERKSAPGGQPPYGYDKQHLSPGGQVLRTLRWMPDGSKQEIAPDGRVIRTIAGDVYVAKAKGDIVRLVPSTPERVRAIQRMFELCVQGYGYRCIAVRMNDEGVPSMFGRHWNMSNIAQMLRNPVYCGSLVYNKRTEGSLFGMSSSGTLRPKKGRRGSFLNASPDISRVLGGLRLRGEPSCDTGWS